MRSEKCGESGPRLQPRYGGQDDAMVFALHSRDLGDQLDLEVAGVQMTPTALAGVVSRTGSAALRTGALPAVLDEHLGLSGRDVEGDVARVPGRGDSKDFRVEVTVSHPRTVTTGIWKLRRGNAYACPHEITPPNSSGFFVSWTSPCPNRGSSTSFSTATPRTRRPQWVGGWLGIPDSTCTSPRPTAARLTWSSRGSRP